MDLMIGTMLGASTLFNIILFLVIGSAAKSDARQKEEIRRLKIELMQTTGERHD